MKPLRTFRLEEYLGEWEFNARYYLTASDAREHDGRGATGPSAATTVREGFMKRCRSRISRRGERRTCARPWPARTTASMPAMCSLSPAPQEALFWAMQELVGPGDHAVVTVPCYQSMETVTLATGADVSALLMRRENGWALDLDELRGLLRPNTKLVAVNYPNNPTGYVPDEATFRALVELCDERGIRLFCDEVYRGIEVDPRAARCRRRRTSRRRPSRSTWPPSPTASPACASAGSPAATAPCSSAWRSASTTHHLQRRSQSSTSRRSRCAIAERIWDRNRGIVAANRPLFEEFFARWADLFDWEPPVGGCVCFPRYKGGDVDDFARRLVMEEGRGRARRRASTISELADAPTDHFRVGLGRLGLEEGLEAFDRFLSKG